MKAILAAGVSVLAIVMSCSSAISGQPGPEEIEEILYRYWWKEPFDVLVENADLVAIGKIAVKRREEYKIHSEVRTPTREPNGSIAYLVRPATINVRYQGQVEVEVILKGGARQAIPFSVSGFNVSGFYGRPGRSLVWEAWDKVNIDDEPTVLVLVLSYLDNPFVLRIGDANVWRVRVRKILQALATEDPSLRRDSWLRWIKGPDPILRLVGLRRFLAQPARGSSQVRYGMREALRRSLNWEGKGPKERDAMLVSVTAALRRQRFAVAEVEAILQALADAYMRSKTVDEMLSVLRALDSLELPILRCEVARLMRKRAPEKAHLLKGDRTEKTKTYSEVLSRVLGMEGGDARSRRGPGTGKAPTPQQIGPAGAERRQPSAGSTGSQ